MKKRDLVLDFTSLLDVIMIILFFFIMFSHFDTEKMKNEYDKKERELKQEKVEIKKRLDELKHLDEKATSNQEALWKLADGQMLEFLIEPSKETDKSSGFSLTIRNGERELVQMGIGETMSDEIKSVLSGEGYDKDSYIFGVVYFNGKTEGTEEAVKNVEKAVKVVGDEYTNFYIKMFNISQTNIITN